MGSSSTMDMVMSLVTSAASSAMTAMASSMDMASSTMDMASSTMSMDMGSETSSSMDMSSMSMHMYFTSAYKDYPVLFSTLYAANGGQAFGIFVLIFIVSFLTKGIEFAKNYLEQKVWNNPNYVIPQQTTIIENCDCDGDESDKAGSADINEDATPTGHRNISLANTLVRDLIRLSLCFIIELLGYAMMLVAMTYSLVYFFAVVTGMTFGRFFFERLSDTMGIRAGSNNFQGHH